MKCQYCTKKATVHLTEIIDGKVTEIHLCEECAKAKSHQMEQEFGLGDLLAGLANFGTPAKQSKQMISCGNCGLTYDKFKSIGRLGCSECYMAFKEEIGGLLKKIHGANRHLGKRPVMMPERSEQDKHAVLIETKERLKKAIVMEDFETAAQLRDEIKNLEKEIK